MIGSFALAITLGIFFGVSLVTNVILVIAVVVQQRNSKQKNNKPGENYISTTQMFALPGCFVPCFYVYRFVTSYMCVLAQNAPHLIFLGGYPRPT